MIGDFRYVTPLYTKGQAADLIGVPRQSFRNWAVGYAYKRMDGVIVAAEPLVTTAGSHGPTVPFVGFAEAYMLAAFRSAKVPMQRIRPAVRWLEEHIGLGQALASERLMTDGAEVLWDFKEYTDDPAEREAIDGLVVVRSGQQVFRPVVRDYLQRVTYQDGWMRMIHLPGYERVEVTVDPWINGGQPTVARRGIRVADVLSRARAGEDWRDIADDYDLQLNEVEALLSQAA
ncbi:uncharacterized protein (DUF433 family) [Streptosporangium becharense]|uniref:Uncharacterized protein (DUF433 family) n=1 Tax=Streptosporangium becharense TaxID=1816182 RepID=A0A7W9IIP1_9ACTN|nr:DUF433 domain-containing protein [Streptosporangium becharense]MBB2915496.1 uncharacterized protein (DUF433 family) [Streptosporangium becharense]MBB5821001.1 uncharacterized protein (DUF433 family) [Streptosporangium becharense]